MTQSSKLRFSATTMCATVAIAFIMPTVVGGVFAKHQRFRGGLGRAGGGIPPAGPQFHAGREGVRTPNFVAPTQGGGFQRLPPQRTNGIPPRNRVIVGQTNVGVTPGVQSQRNFTITQQGRNYDNGLNLRRARQNNTNWLTNYYPYGYTYFPGYYSNYAYGTSVISPWAYYFGVNAPYIGISYAQWYPPAVNFIDIPTYTPAKEFGGFYHAATANLINDPNVYKNDPGLDTALDNIVETFRGHDVNSLVTLVEPNTSIAVYTGGHYQYSMAAHDFVDLTRDTIRRTQTTGFQLTTLHQRSPGVVCVSGQHSYQDQSGAQHSVYVSFVLQDIGGQWTLTQVGTAPETLRNI